MSLLAPTSSASAQRPGEGRGDIVSYGRGTNPGVAATAYEFVPDSPPAELDGRSPAPVAAGAVDEEGQAVDEAKEPAPPYLCAPGGEAPAICYATIADLDGRPEHMLVIASEDRAEEEPEREPRSRPSPEGLAAAAADEAMALAEGPRLRVAPSRRGVTGLDSFVWLARRPRPVSATARVPALSVTAEARPVQFVWEFGDGDDKVTRDSGRPWRRGPRGNIAHMYEAKGVYDLSVEVIWEARWRMGDGPWRPLGYFSNSDSRSYRVREVRSVLVPAG